MADASRRRVENTGDSVAASAYWPIHYAGKTKPAWSSCAEASPQITPKISRHTDSSNRRGSTSWGAVQGTGGMPVLGGARLALRLSSGDVNARGESNGDTNAPAQQYESHNGSSEDASFFNRYFTPDKLAPVAVAPSLRLDSVLALSGGAALLFKLYGRCDGEPCAGQFLFLDGELGLHGRQVRLGLAMGVIDPFLVRYLLWNWFGFSVAGAYLQRTANSEQKLAAPED